MRLSPELSSMLSEIANSNPFEQRFSHASGQARVVSSPFDTHLVAADLAEDEGHPMLAESLRYMAEHQLHPEVVDIGTEPKYAHVWQDGGWRDQTNQPHEIHSEIHIRMPKVREGGYPAYGGMRVYDDPKEAHEDFHRGYQAWREDSNGDAVPAWQFS